MTPILASKRSQDEAKAKVHEITDQIAIELDCPAEVEDEDIETPLWDLELQSY